MVALPFKTPEGYNILVYRLSDSDPSKMHFGNAVKAFCMFNDVRISEDGMLVSTSPFCSSMLISDIR